MLLDELYIPPTKQEAGKILAKAGYKRIGKPSAFGHVYHKEGDKSVLKLFAARDRAYVAFAKLAIKHQDNPHFPRLSKRVVELKGTDYLAIRTEILSEVPSTMAFRDVIEYIAIYTYAYREQVDLVDAVSEFLDYESFFAKQLADEIKEYMADKPLIREACELISALPYRSDIRKDNFMMRGDVLVFNDPVQNN